MTTLRASVALLTRIATSRSLAVLLQLTILAILFGVAGRM